MTDTSTTTATISAESVRTTLRAVRYDRALYEMPLRTLSLVDLELESQGLAESREARSWALSWILRLLFGLRSKLTERTGSLLFVHR